MRNIKLDSKLATVQVWKGPAFITANMPIEKANNLIKEGRAFVLTPQAIGIVQQ